MHDTFSQCFETRAKMVSGTTNIFHANCTLPDRMFSGMGASSSLITVAAAGKLIQVKMSLSLYFALSTNVPEL